MAKVLTESEVAAIGGTSTSYGNRCCTKARAEALDCTVIEPSNAANNQLITSVIRSDGRKKIGNYEVVDLGLSNGLLFATWNVGANTETGYGNYYMYGNGSRTYNKDDSPYTGTENPLSSSVDTATQVMGYGWRMPTQAELEDLINKTNYTWITINGINGGKFTSKTNPNTYVFFPAAGSYTNGNHYNEGNYSFIWSSTHGSNNVFFYLLLNSNNKIVSNTLRSAGISVRGVHAAV